MPFATVEYAIPTTDSLASSRWESPTTHSRESDVLTTHSLMSHFIGETSGRVNCTSTRWRHNACLPNLFAEWEGWGFLDGSYFCFITLRYGTTGCPIWSGTWVGLRGLHTGCPIWSGTWVGLTEGGRGDYIQGVPSGPGNGLGWL